MIAEAVKRAWEKVLSWIYPERCILCRDLPIMGDGEFKKYGLCSNCRMEDYRLSLSLWKPAQEPAAKTEPPILAGHASYRYEDRLRDALERLKYGKRKRYAACFGRWMFEESKTSPEFSACLSKTDLLVPVPLAPKRLQERGYNQSALLSETLSEETGIPMVEVLERCRETRFQKSLGIAMRTRNVEGAFRVRCDLKIDPPSRVVLVDDIFTTGATLEACIKALKEKWPQASVIWWTFTGEQ